MWNRDEVRAHLAAGLLEPAPQVFRTRAVDRAEGEKLARLFRAFIHEHDSMKVLPA